MTIQDDKTYIQDNMTIHNADCMTIMAGYEDNYFDLAVVDCPYGIKMDGRSMPKNTASVIQKNGRALQVERSNYEGKEWDNNAPDRSYFVELQRVSKNQILWGANHFVENIPNANSSCWIVWDKCNVGTNQSDCELALATFKTTVRKFTFMWSGMFQGSSKDGSKMEGNKKLNEKRIHPTQKPIQLYNWIYANYAEPGQKILDTHGGSFSNAIAAHYAKMHFVGCELDEDYYKAAIERIRKETRQQEFEF